jgi:hypothetical protein
MPITIVDYVKSIVGDKPAYHAEDFTSNGVAMLGGCELCYAVLAGYNAYPSRSGYWRCADHIGGTGYATIAEFKASVFGTGCPSCGDSGNIHETRITTGERAEEYALECSECHQVWQP